jgi:hypothetical protein
MSEDENYMQKIILTWKVQNLSEKSLEVVLTSNP